MGIKNEKTTIQVAEVPNTRAVAVKIIEEYDSPKYDRDPETKKYGPTGEYDHEVEEHYVVARESLVGEYNPHRWSIERPGYDELVVVYSEQELDTLVAVLQEVKRVGFTIDAPGHSEDTSGAAN